MCGRNTHHYTWSQIVDLYRLTEDPLKREGETGRRPPQKITGAGTLRILQGCVIAVAKPWQKGR
jgi:hypothetical protein